MIKNSLFRATLAGVIFVSTGAAYADSQEEVNKQISKLIGDAISARVSARALDAAPGQRPGVPTDPNNIWASYSHIAVDFSVPGAVAGTPTSFRTNAFVGGYDRDLTDKLIAGAALSYSETNNDGGQSWGLQPYLSYRFTDSIFGIAKVGYNRSDSDTASSITGGGFSSSTTSSTKTDTYSWGVSLNGLYKAGDLAAKGRLEVGTADSDTSTSGTTTTTFLGITTTTPASSSTKSGTTMYIGDGELDYYFSPGFYGFAGVQLFQTNKSNSYSSYGRIGLEKEISKGSAVSVKYETKLDDNQPGGTDFEVNTISVAVRIRF